MTAYGSRTFKYPSLIQKIGADQEGVKIMPYLLDMSQDINQIFESLEKYINKDNQYNIMEEQRVKDERALNKKIKYDISLPAKWKIVDFDFLLDATIIVCFPYILTGALDDLATSSSPRDTKSFIALFKSALDKIGGPRSAFSQNDTFVQFETAYRYMLSQFFILTENELQPMNINTKKFIMDFFSFEIQSIKEAISDKLFYIADFELLYNMLKDDIAKHVKETGNRNEDFEFTIKEKLGDEKSDDVSILTIPAKFLKPLFVYIKLFGSVFDVKSRIQYLKEITKKYSPSVKSSISDREKMYDVARTALYSKLRPMSIDQISRASKSTVFNTEHLTHLTSVLPSDRASSLTQAVSHLVTLAEHKPEEAESIFLNDLHVPLKSLSERRGNGLLTEAGEASFHRMVDSFIQNANTKIQKEQELDRRTTRVGAKVSPLSASFKSQEKNIVSMPSIMMAHSMIVTKTAGSRGKVEYLSRKILGASIPNLNDPFDIEGLDDDAMDEEKNDMDGDSFTEVWQERLNFLANKKDSDPVYYNTGVNIMHWKNTKEQHLSIIDNDFIYPFNVIAFRPTRKFETSSGIIGKFGKDTGFVAVGNANFLFGTDVATKTHEGHFTIYIGVIIYGTKNYVMLSDLYIKRYLGGSGTEFYRKQDIDELRLNNFNPPNALHRPSIVSTLMPYGYRPFKFVDIRGYFSGSLTARNDNRPPTYITTESFYRAFDFNNAEVSVPVFVEGETTANYICGQEWQIQYNYDKSDYVSEVMGEDCLGNVLYPGARGVFEMHDPSSAILNADEKQKGLVPAVW